MKDRTSNPLAKAADQVQKTNSGQKAFEIKAQAIPVGPKPKGVK